MFGDVIIMSFFPLSHSSVTSVISRRFSGSLMVLFSGYNFYKIARILLDALTTTNVVTCDRIFP